MSEGERPDERARPVPPVEPAAPLQRVEPALPLQPVEPSALAAQLPPTDRLPLDRPTADRPPADAPLPDGPPPDGPPLDSPPLDSPPLEVPPAHAHRAPTTLPLPAVLALAAVVALVAGLLGGLGGAWWQNHRDNGGPGISLPRASGGSTARPADSVAGVVRRVLPSVVTIKVTGSQVSDTGSGFVLHSSGYVVTNNHVVSAAATGGTISVVFADGKSVKGTIVGRDASYDLAVVKVARTGVPELTLGESKDVVVGDPVIAVGAPLGLQGSVTTGIVSALNRPVTAGEVRSESSFINAIQTDAAINPGNSGGPLVDAAGDVIGVNSAIAQLPGGSGLGAQSGSIGVGFAIPSDQVRTTAEQLISTGKALHPVIGVLLDQQYQGEGVQVAKSASNGQPPITPGGPADRAGIKPGDVITAIDGHPASDSDEFVVAIRAHAPGDVVTLTVRTGSKERTVMVTLQGSSE
jgi:putative serine protease PepD